MSIFTIFALVILPILGGFIAWAGDIIGYRLGKSRRSLLGLRPRSTARLVAVIVGVVLPLATMLVAAAGSATVRTALLHLTDLQQNNLSLESRNAALMQRLNTSRQQKDVAEKDAQDAQQRAQEARTRLTAAQAELNRAQASLHATQGKLRAADDKRRQLDAEVMKLEESRKGLETQLAQAGRQLAVTAQQLAGINREWRQAEGQKAAAEQRVKQLQATRDDLALEVEKAQRDLGEAQRNLAATQDELQAKTKQLQATEDTLKTAKDALAVAGNIYTQWGLVATRGAVRYEPGTELIRATIDAQQSQEQIESSLRELEILASDNAQRGPRGVQEPEGALAVRLIMPIPPGTPPDELPDEAQIISMVAREIRESGVPQCVAVIEVSLRSFVGDNRPVAAELSFRRNTLVYPRGTVIVHRIIDGSRPRAQVFQELWGAQNGLLGDLREAAQQAGLMPDLKSGQYGEIPAEELLQALDTLLASKQKQEVQAVAAQDVWVANDPLFTVTLKVGPPQEQSGE